MKYVYKHFAQKEANSYFAAIPAEDNTPAVDLVNAMVTTCGALSTQHPRKGGGDEQYLVIENENVRATEKWWKHLKRVEHNGVVYTILKGHLLHRDEPFEVDGISSDDNQLYHLIWNPQLKKLIPSDELLHQKREA